MSESKKYWVVIHYETETGNYSLLWDKSSSLAPDIQSQLEKLSLEQLELLSLDALEFSTVDELKIYLDKFTEA